MHLPSYTLNKDPYLMNRHLKNVNNGQMFSQHNLKIPTKFTVATKEFSCLQ